MTPEMLLEQFDVVADAPNGVQKLRELILQLAVRGKLVPQDPSDEPASVLLEQLEADKWRLHREGKLGKQHELPPIRREDMAFEVPHGWEWARIGEVTSKLGSGSTPHGGKRAYMKEGVKFLRSQNVWNHGLRLDDVAHIPPSVHIQMSGTAVEPGDVLLNITGASIGRSAVVPDDFDEGNVSQHVSIIRPIRKDLRHFLHLSLISPYFQNLIMQVQVGISREGLSKARLSELVVPIPPLPEQHRIVEKVDQLMALCDKLEERQRRREETRVRGSRAALHHLTTDTANTVLSDNWRRIKDNFHLLYDAPGTLSELRQAILQLAIRGKLVPQNPSDDPASVLLERIAEEKRLLASEGKISTPKSLPAVKSQEVPFEVPEGWEWVRFGDVTLNRDAERVPVPSTVRETRQGPFPYYGASGIIDYINDFIFDGTLLLIGEDGANLVLRSTPIAFFAEGKYWVNNHAHVIDGISIDLLRFVAVFINAIDLKPFVTGTAQPKLNQAKLQSIPIALPPLPEQRRIVEKVDRLMALCDQLEAQLSQSRTKAEQLASAVVHHLTAA
ncbi:MAG: restriction endonuclease subunit S [Longimicrobiaceae bacterium]